MTLSSRLGLAVSLEQLEEDVNAFVALYDGKEGLPDPEVWQEVEGRWRKIVADEDSWEEEDRWMESLEEADKAADEEERREAEEREDGEREVEGVDGRKGLGKGEGGEVTQLRGEL